MGLIGVDSTLDNDGTNLNGIQQPCRVEISSCIDHRQSWGFSASRCYKESLHPLPINTLAPGKFERNFRHVNCKWILVINGWYISCENAMIWMFLDFTDVQSTLVQVMVWCQQATSHHLSQCWPKSMSQSGVTRPQWVCIENKIYHIYSYLSSSSTVETIICDISRFIIKCWHLMECTKIVTYIPQPYFGDWIILNNC